MTVQALQVAFRLKEDLAAQMLHYDVSVGAYMQLDDPRPLVQEVLALLIPRPMAEEVSSPEKHHAVHAGSDCTAVLPSRMRHLIRAQVAGVHSVALPASHSLPSLSPQPDTAQPHRQTCQIKLVLLIRSWSATSCIHCMMARLEMFQCTCMYTQVLHLEPQGRCLNDASARRGRKPFRLSLQVRVLIAFSTAQSPDHQSDTHPAAARDTVFDGACRIPLSP